MIRLDEKSLLIKDCCSIYSYMSRYYSCLPRSFIRITNKSVMRDYKKGLKAIDKKCPVYIEMPNLRNEGNGMYSEEYSNKNENVNKEIVVTTPLVVTKSPSCRTKKVQ